MLGYSLLSQFTKHPYVPALMIWHVIQPCHMNVHITHHISHSSVIAVECVITTEITFCVDIYIYTKPPECVDIMCRTS